MNKDVRIDSSKVDLKARLAEHLPSLLQLMGDKPFAWRDVNKKFIRHFTKRVQDYVANGNFLQKEINFYDVISQRLLGNSNYLPLFTYFDNLLKELNMYVAHEKKELLSGTFWNLLTNLDLDFLHFVGELSVLNNLVKSGYTLESVETPLPHGKRIDFTMKNANNKSVLVEVVNIRLWSAEDKADEQLVRFIQGKLLDKVNDKAREDPANIIFHIVPVLWGSHKMLIRIKDLYDEHLNMHHLNINEPVAYGCFTYSNQFIVKFATLKTLFVN